MNIRAAQKIKYGGSAQARVVPVLVLNSVLFYSILFYSVLFYSILFHSILNMLFKNVSLLDNVALVTDELMSMEH